MNTFKIFERLVINPASYARNNSCGLAGRQFIPLGQPTSTREQIVLLDWMSVHLRNHRIQNRYGRHTITAAQRLRTEPTRSEKSASIPTFQTCEPEILGGKLCIIY